MKREVDQLQEQKVQMSESEKGPCIDAINMFIEESLQYYKHLIAQKEDDKKEEWDELNQAFKEDLS